ncbi:hypothetical protein AMECASPLE_005685 [Ameca splendens]|uniref:Uncharacterized protein n=1 Tax=Ameca splendens TaxID=208324 RepID=A0ABV0XZ29_9TELE
MGERRGTPWTGRQSITGQHTQTTMHTLIHTPKGNLELPINLTGMSLDCGRKPEYPSGVFKVDIKSPVCTCPNQGSFSSVTAAVITFQGVKTRLLKGNYEEGRAVIFDPEKEGSSALVGMVEKSLPHCTCRSSHTCLLSL